MSRKETSANSSPRFRRSSTNHQFDPPSDHLAKSMTKKSIGQAATKKVKKNPKKMADKIDSTSNTLPVRVRSEKTSKNSKKIFRNVKPETAAKMTREVADTKLARGEEWTSLKTYEDIRLEVTADGIAKITICRPEVRNAFRPKTVQELLDALTVARDDQSVGAVILTGQGDLAFCSGGDQRVRGVGGYVGQDGIPRLNILDVQKAIRSLPKPVVAMVAGFAVGGGHVLHVVCDLTIAAENARFGQTGPKVGSFDGGLGSSYLARIVGQKKAREIWYLCRQYNAQQALEMGLVNTVVPLQDLEKETLSWCREMLAHSPLALRCLKAALNADCDGQIGLLDLAGNATLLYYLSEEAHEGKKAYLEKRKPDFKKFARLP